jgi:D-psicose/D-tagatose/L-ribulose 3-epimerase
MANKLGCHALMFGESWDEAAARRTIDTVARLGFDVVETLMFDVDAVDGRMTRRLAADAGIEVALGMALGPDADVSSPDPAVSRRGEETIERALAVAEEAGATAISGITYAAFNRYHAPPAPARRSQVVDALGRLARTAASRGQRIGLEPVNRYESYLVNTLDEAGAIIREIGSNALFVHMDTFHMNIEEKDVAGAIARNADLLGYAHVADNHRGALGAGTFDFKTYFRALARAGYEGGVTVESFSSRVLGPDIVGAVALWRPSWSDPESAAREALDFVRVELASAAAAANAT